MSCKLLSMFVVLMALPLALAFTLIIEFIWVVCRDLAAKYRRRKEWRRVR